MSSFNFLFDKITRQQVIWVLAWSLIFCFSALFVLPSASQKLLFADGNKEGEVVSGALTESPSDEARAPVEANKNDNELIVASGRANTLSGRIVFNDENAFKELRLGNLDISPFMATKDNKRRFKVPERKRWIDLGISDESLIVGEDGGIANVIVWALDVPDIQDWSGPIPSPTVVAKDGRFQPRVLPFWNWGKLKFVNEMPESVDFHLQGLKNSCNVGLTQRGKPIRQGGLGAEYESQLDPEPVPVELKSNRNYWMKSYVLPLKHPCFAITDKNGDFKINHLPPGETEFAMWHEKVGWLKTQRYPTGRFKFNVVYAENSIGNVELETAPFKKTLGNKPLP